MKIYRIAKDETLHIEKEELSDRTRYLLKNDKGEAVGKLTLQDLDRIPGNKQKVYLSAFQIKEQYRGHGYGRMLMEEALKDPRFIKKSIVVNPASYDDNDPRYTVESLTSMYSHFGFKPMPNRNALILERK